MHEYCVLLFCDLIVCQIPPHIKASTPGGPCSTQPAAADPAADTSQTRVVSKRKGQGKSLGDLEAAVLHVLCEDEASQEQQDKDDGPRLAGEADEAPASVSPCSLLPSVQKCSMRT
jgi:hypothetical protein